MILGRMLSPVRRVARRWAAYAPLAAVVLGAACGGASDGAAQRPRPSETALPIASASAPAAAPVASEAASEPMPRWAEPDDPVDAYRELMDKVAFLRAQPSLEIFRATYVPGSDLGAAVRADVRRMRRRDIRLVDGRTVLEEVRLLSQDDDTAFLRVQAREHGWVTVDADGGRTAEPTQCEEYVVELRDRGEGWRIATLILEGEDSIRRCER